MTPRLASSIRLSTTATQVPRGLSGQACLPRHAHTPLSALHCALQNHAWLYSKKAGHTSCTVLVLRVSSELPEHACLLISHEADLCTRAGGHIIHWSPCSKYLRMLLGVNEHSTPSLLVRECATGSCTTPVWTSDAAAALQGGFHEDNTEREMIFSPDGRLLLFWQCYGPGGSISLVILDIRTGSFVAASALMQIPSKWHHAQQYRYVDAVRLLWHPSSRGLVIPGSLYELADAHKQGWLLATAPCLHI